MSDNTNDNNNVKDKNDIKKQLKEEKKKEKLAKLALKQLNLKNVTAKPKPKKSSKGYDPTEVEAKWVKYWAENKSFTCDDTSNDNNFCMVIPPPNITGSLHIGHAMMIAIEDTIVRYQRLNGKNVLYLPGLDHAGIATQSVVLKNLAKEGHTNVTREFFMEKANEWARTYGSRIINQFNRMGTSLDFTKQLFTLDPNVSKAVSKAFVQLYKKGLIYRENKIVNWSGKLKTTLSDLEVNYKEIEGGTVLDIDGGSYECGMMYFIKYFILPPEKVSFYREAIERIRKLHQSSAGENNLKLEEEISREIYGGLPFVLVGTTRPETILGDSGLCINPDDERFFDPSRIFSCNKVEDVTNIKNKTDTNSNVKTNVTDTNSNVKLNVTDVNEELKAEKKNKYKINKETSSKSITIINFYGINPVTYEIIPVVYDDHANLTLGTGVLKVTPAHDPVDFQLGVKHSLEVKVVIDQTNKISLEGSYQGMGRFEVRELLKKHPCMISIEKYNQVLPFCSRSNDLVEPMVKEQWWLKCDGMAAKAIEGVKTGEIKLVPEEAKGVWNRWLENIRDWCLSRQLWWGHQIPAYSYEVEGQRHWVVAETKEEALKEISNLNYNNFKQDEDVLDTWFSSGLWPFSTLRWGQDDQKFLENFFPNSMLETGSDILFFWVARMVMLSYELLGQRPFDTILLHGIVRDAHGRKMSKSLGNVIDPLYVVEGATQEELVSKISVNVSEKEMERAALSIRKDYPHGIPKCGADALRFTLLSYTNGMKDINLDILRVAGYSRLCNKIYNAFKFVELKVGALDISSLEDGLFVRNISALSMHDKFMLNKLNLCIKDQHKNHAIYNFMNCTQSIHQTFLYDFCDVYIEVCKGFDSEDNLKNLLYVFISLLKIFNPMMPFITQEIYSKLRKNDNLILEFPKVLEIDLENSFEDVISLSKLVRINEKVLVSKYKDYLELLSKGKEITETESTEGFERIGDIFYKFI